MKIKLFSFLLLLILSISLSANAAETKTVDQQTYSVSRFFTDESENYDFYVVKTSEDGLQYETIVHNKIENTWSRLDKKYYFYKDQSLDCIYVNTNEIVDHTFYDSTSYDPQRNVITVGNQFKKSPNQKWGFLCKQYSWSVPHYDSDGNRNGSIGSNVHSLFVKDMQSGKIKKILDSGMWIDTRWLNSNALLICAYSENKKQKEIIVYNPANNSFKNLALGTLKGYLPGKNLVFYVGNQKDRPGRVIDMLTGNERPLEDSNESAAFFPIPKEENLPDFPRDINIYEIPVITPEIEFEYQHKIEVGSQSILLPMIFEEKGNTFIPLRPLMEPLGIKVKVINPSQSDYSYEISYQGQNLIVSNDNGLIYKQRLYLTPKILLDLGIKKFSLKTNA